MSVIWHDLECGAYTEDLPRLAATGGAPRRSGARRRSRDRPRDARSRACRACGHRARYRSGAAGRIGAPGGRARASRHRRRRRAELSTSGGASRSASCRCRRSSCSAARGGGRRFSGALASICSTEACSRSRSPMSWICSRYRRGRRHRCPTCARSTASSTRADRPRSAPTATASSSSENGRS